MKTYNILAAGAVMMAAALFQSCLKDDDRVRYSDIVPNAVVTVKPDGDKFYLQLDDSTVIYPDNVQKSPFGDKEVRAFINYRVISQEAGSQVGYVNWFRELLTKNTVATQGADKDEASYGNDPVEIVNAFPTVCEDGYLTLRFRTSWGRYGSVQHMVNLITGVDPEDPYTVEFRHNANGDMKDVISDAYVAFRLDQLPDTKGEKVTLKVKYISPDGYKTIQFKYRTRPTDSK